VRDIIDLPCYGFSGVMWSQLHAAGENCCVYVDLGKHSGTW